MILTRRFGALRAFRTDSDTPRVQDERALHTDAAKVERKHVAERDTDTKAA